MFIYGAREISFPPYRSAVGLPSSSDQTLNGSVVLSRAPAVQSKQRHAYTIGLLAPKPVIGEAKIVLKTRALLAVSWS
jgi:hypothetical protein